MTAKTPDLAPPSRPPTLKAHAYALIRDAILAGKHRPGARLNESQLARDLNISRIPVREALMQLQEHGLVTNLERRGMFVTALSEDEAGQMNGLRIVLEAEAIRLCRARMTRPLAARLIALVEQLEKTAAAGETEQANLELEFHRTVSKAAGNPHLSRTLDALTALLFIQAPGSNTGKAAPPPHRILLDAILGPGDVVAEAAVIRFLKARFDRPEAYSSFAGAELTPLGSPQVSEVKPAVSRPRIL